jgi:hypothetical protein
MNGEKTKELIRKVFNKRATILFLAIIGLFITGLYLINNFFEKNEIIFKSPAEITFQAPITISQRENKTVVIEIIKDASLPLTENEQYLCQKFGNQCKTALEIQRRENATGDCDIFNVNKNGSVDFGFMQVNSVHLGADIKLSQLIDCKSNIDVAYEIYKKFGWNAWTTYSKVK